MRTRIILALVLLLLVLAPGYGLAQEGTPTIQPAPTGTPVPTPTIIPTPTTDPEILVLQAQLEQMRETDSQMLDMVLWAMGVVFTLAVAIVGYNWYVSRLQYERDKRVIKDEILNELSRDINTRIEENATGIHERISRQRSSFDDDLRKSRTELEAVQQRLETRINILNGDLSFIEEDYKNAWVVYRTCLIDLISFFRINADHMDVDTPEFKYKAILMKGVLSTELDHILGCLKTVLNAGYKISQKQSALILEMIGHIPGSVYDDHKLEIEHFISVVQKGIANSDVMLDVKDEDSNPGSTE